LYANNTLHCTTLLVASVTVDLARGTSYNTPMPDDAPATPPVDIPDYDPIRDKGYDPMTPGLVPPKRASSPGDKAPED